ncbi:hypothetical protein FD755_020119, partial [Muntiacus reevesi]
LPCSPALKLSSQSSLKFPVLKRPNSSSPANGLRLQQSVAFDPALRTQYHPTKGSTQSVGYDQYSAYGYTVPPVEKGLIKTNIQIVLPSGCYGRVAPHLDGIVDEVYGGNVGVIVCPEIEEFQILNNAEGGSGGFDSTGNN